MPWIVCVLLLIGCRSVEYVPYPVTNVQTEYRDRLVRDSIVLHDSIPVPYPVERKLGRWEQVKVDYGGVAIGVVAVMVFAVFGWIVYKLKK